jgi:hypothetical protein
MSPEMKGHDLNTQAGKDLFVKLLGTNPLTEPLEVRKRIDHMIAHDKNLWRDYSWSSWK